MRAFAASVAILVAASCGSAQAADMLMSQPSAYCAQPQGALLLSITDNTALSSEVTRRMDHAISVSHDPRWINSRSAAFTWANEAKAACGIAYGYLRSNYRDDEFLSKCECFHDRMVEQMH